MLSQLSNMRRQDDLKLPLAHLDLMHGWRLWTTVLSLSLGLLLSALETSIVATALVTLSTDLGEYSKSNWVVTAYLITYTGFLAVFARLSDLLGRKSAFLAALAIFTAFSLACGLSQTMKQLIVFRAFQGIGGAGLYTLALTVMTEVTPQRHTGLVAAGVGSIFAMASIAGPVLGGKITGSGASSWRWVFLLNVPAGSVLLVVAFASFPRNAGPLTITGRTLFGVDFVGIAVSLLTCVPLIFALENGGIQYPWGSHIIIAAFTVAGTGFIGLLLWQWIISKWLTLTPLLPLFPLHLITRRVIGCTMLTAFFTGFPFMSTLILLPQQLQLEYGLSPVRAGIHMLALLLLSATGATMGGVLSSNWGISWYLLAGSQALQMIGLGLLSMSPARNGSVPSLLPAYQVILGLGFGLSLSSLTSVVRAEVEQRDDGISISTVTQVRLLGGLFAVAIGQVVIFSRLKSEVGPVIGQEKLTSLLRSTAAIGTFPPTEAVLVMQCYGRAFRLQDRILVAFSGAGLVSCIGAWRKHVESGIEHERRRRDMESRTWVGRHVSKVVRSASRAPRVELSWEEGDHERWRLDMESRVRIGRRVSRLVRSVSRAPRVDLPRDGDGDLALLRDFERFT